MEIATVSKCHVHKCHLNAFLEIKNVYPSLQPLIQWCSDNICSASVHFLPKTSINKINLHSFLKKKRFWNSLSQTIGKLFCNKYIYVDRSVRGINAWKIAMHIQAITTAQSLVDLIEQNWSMLWCMQKRLHNYHS